MRSLLARLAASAACSTVSQLKSRAVLFSVPNLQTQRIQYLTLRLPVGRRPTPGDQTILQLTFWDAEMTVGSFPGQPRGTKMG